MALLLFLPIDALSSAGGTKIKYIDTITTVDISEYGNILGAIYLESLNSSTTYGLILLKNKTKTAFYNLYLSNHSESYTDFFSANDIRVFYF